MQIKSEKAPRKHQIHGAGSLGTFYNANCLSSVAEGLMSASVLMSGCDTVPPYIRDSRLLMSSHFVPSTAVALGFINFHKSER